MVHSNTPSIFYIVLKNQVSLLEIGHSIGIVYDVYETNIINDVRNNDVSEFKGSAFATAFGGIITFLVQVCHFFLFFYLLPHCPEIQRVIFCYQTIPPLPKPLALHRPFLHHSFRCKASWELLSCLSRIFFPLLRQLRFVQWLAYNIFTIRWRFN